MKALACVLALAFAASLAAAPIAPGIDPARTYALVVGVLEWQRKEDWDSFDNTFRRDAMLVEHLRSRGVPAAQLTYLQDKEATLARIRTSLADLTSRARAGDTLLVYYCGHGFLEAGEGYFANYDIGARRPTYWGMSELVDTIQDKFQGARCILIADCCHSGRLVETVERHKPTRIEYGVFTSVTAADTSTGNWTFSQSVYDALTGSPLVDRNRDGAITCAELIEYAAEEMTVFEGQRSQCGLIGGFSPDTVLSTARFTKVPPHYGERVKVYDAEEWWSGRIIDFKNNKALVRWVKIGWDTQESDEWYPYPACKPLKLVQYPVGKRIQIKWKRKWYPGKVLKVEGSKHLVRYDGWDASYNEWVSPGRIRIPRKRK